MDNLIQNKNNATTIMRRYAPVLSGNLRQNAVRSRLAHNGFIVFVDDNVAPYGFLLDQGRVKGKGQNSIGWFSTSGTQAVGVYMNGSRNESRKTLSASKEIVALTEPNTIEREVVYLNNIRRSTR